MLLSLVLLLLRLLFLFIVVVCDHTKVELDDEQLETIFSSDVEGFNIFNASFVQSLRHYTVGCTPF